MPSQIAEPAAVEPTVVEDPPGRAPAAVAEESESSAVADDPDALYESQPAVFIPPEIKERASVETTYVAAAASVATIVEDPPLEQSSSFSGALSCGVFDVDTSCVGCTFGDDGAGVPR